MYEADANRGLARGEGVATTVRTWAKRGVYATKWRFRKSEDVSAASEGREPGYGACETTMEVWGPSIDTHPCSRGLKFVNVSGKCVVVAYPIAMRSQATVTSNLFSSPRLAGQAEKRKTATKGTEKTTEKF